MGKEVSRERVLSYTHISILEQQPCNQVHGVFGCTKNAEGQVSFLTCMPSRVERW